jgi:hypothetical protein
MNSESCRVCAGLKVRKGLVHHEGHEAHEVKRIKEDQDKIRTFISMAGRASPGTRRTVSKRSQDETVLDQRQGPRRRNPLPELTAAAKTRKEKNL